MACNSLSSNPLPEVMWKFCNQPIHYKLIFSKPQWFTVSLWKGWCVVSLYSLRCIVLLLLLFPESILHNLTIYVSKVPKHWPYIYIYIVSQFEFMFDDPHNPDKTKSRRSYLYYRSHTFKNSIYIWKKVYLFTSSTILLLFILAAVNWSPNSQSEAMWENSQGPSLKPKQIPLLLWWRNGYPWIFPTPPISAKLCVKLKKKKKKQKQTNNTATKQNKTKQKINKLKQETKHNKQTSKPELTNDRVLHDLPLNL